MRPVRLPGVRPGLLVLAGGLLLRLSPPPPADAGGPAALADAPDAVAPDFVPDAGPPGHFFMPQIMGSGAALFDFDGDGRLDLSLLQSAGPDAPARNRLYRQKADGRFA